MSSALYILHFILSLLIAVFAGFIYFKTQHFRKVSGWIGVFSIVYGIYSIVYLLWFLGILLFSVNDAFLLMSFGAVVEAISFFGLIYSILGQKKLIYLVLFYFLCLIFSTFLGFVFSSLIISYVFIFAIFLFLISNRPDLKNECYAIFAYAITSFLASVFFYFSMESVASSFVSKIFLILFFYFFYIDLGKLRVRERLAKRKYPMVFLRHLIFVITLANLLFISTVGVHEAGHVVSAKLFGCEKIKTVIYEEGGFSQTAAPYTELYCLDSKYNLFIVLSGVFLPLFAALALFASNNIVISKLSFLMMGFALIIAYTDFEVIGLSKSLTFVLFLSGIAILIVSAINIVRADRDEMMQ